MPARSKTTEAEIVRATRTLLERAGREGFSMNEVAAAVGIRAPSLYGRFKDRAGLLAAVELQVCAEVREKLGRLVVPGDPGATLMDQAKAVRRFALAHPHSYALIFDIRSVRTRASTAARAAALDPIMPALGALAGEENALAAARVLVPFLHGFISMELAQGFRLGGKVYPAFLRGVAVILRGIAKPFPA